MHHLTTVLPQIHPFTFGDEPANAGDTVGVQCMVTKGDAPISIMWSLNGNNVKDIPGITVTKIGHKSSSLSIDLVSSIHKGTYTCLASNQAGHANYSTELAVNVAPQITPFDFSEDILNAGDTVSLICTVGKGDLPLSIHWLLNNETLNSGNSILINRNGKRISVLSIENVQHEHIGNYTCIAENEAGRSTHSALLNVNVGPQIMPFDFGTEPINDQEMAAVTCTASKGDSPFTLQWYFNGQIIKSGVNGVVLFNTKRTSQLSIESVSHHHQGNYTCLVKNQAGSVNHTAELYVNVPPQIKPFDFGEEPVNAQEMVLVTCAVNKGDQPLVIEWYFNGKKLKPGDTGISVSNTKRFSQLNMDSVSHQNQGNYTCVVKNEAGSVNYTSQLFVNVAPVIIPFEFDGSVFYGEAVQVMCHVPKGDKPLTFKWSFNGGDVSSLPGLNIMNVGDMGSALIIPAVTAAHSGNYTCTAANVVARASHLATLNVKVLPYIVPFEADESIFAGEPVQLTCLVSKGDLPVDIKWHFHGYENESSHLGIMTTKMTSRTSFLSIAAAGAGHSGRYTCTAANSAGIANYSTVINVRVLPHIKPFELDEAVFAGETVHLDCYVSKGDIPLNISWSFKGASVTQKMGIKTSKPSERVSTLDIRNALGSNSGNYTCSASNAAGTTNHTAVLNVIVPPQINSFEFSEEPVNAQEMVLVTCTVSKGDQPLNIEWYFNGNKVVSGALGINLSNTKRTSQLSIESVLCHVTKGDMPLSLKWLFRGRPVDNIKGVTVSKVGDKSSILAIPSVTEKHSGNYTCTAWNTVASANHTATLNVQVPPHIVPFEAEEPVFAGESMQLTCHISKGDAPIAINWSFHGKDLSSHQGISTTKIGDRTSVLTISSAVASHSGEYSCHASNKAGLAVHSTTVNVHVLPYIVPFEADEFVFAGESVQLNCHVSKGDLPLDIKWHFHGFDNSSSHLGIMTTKMTSRTSFLSIAAAAASHSGNYTCVAANNAGATNHSTVLNVHVKPNILPFDVDQALFSGESVQMMCHISKGDTPLDVHWEFNGKRLSRELGTFSSVGERSSVLVLPSVVGAHSGHYTCIAKNRAGTATYTTILKVIVVPYINPFEVEESIFAGESIHLTCHVSKGDRPLQISWSFQGQEIPYHNNMGITTTKLGEKASVLSVPTAMGHHSGNYTCTASNRAGRAHHTVLVNIHGSTSLPTYV
ncbi:Hemicentin-1 [Papilio xuthus]|uniref:Hemicentin-1 n=1 Tax=Papilio xuthus TaxID=66420 RepID=A0A194PNX2_PAPXU|nr:Hemicentin-1 [Papilio xuthus]